MYKFSIFLVIMILNSLQIQGMNNPEVHNNGKLSMIDALRDAIAKRRQFIVESPYKNDNDNSDWSDEENNQENEESSTTTSQVSQQTVSISQKNEDFLKNRAAFAKKFIPQINNPNQKQPMESNILKIAQKSDTKIERYSKTPVKAKPNIKLTNRPLPKTPMRKNFEQHKIVLAELEQAFLDEANRVAITKQHVPWSQRIENYEPKALGGLTFSDYAKIKCYMQNYLNEMCKRKNLNVNNFNLEALLPPFESIPQIKIEEELNELYTEIYDEYRRTAIERFNAKLPHNADGLTYEDIEKVNQLRLNAYTKLIKKSNIVENMHPKFETLEFKSNNIELKKNKYNLTTQFCITADLDQITKELDNIYQNLYTHHRSINNSTIKNNDGFTTIDLEIIFQNFYKEYLNICRKNGIKILSYHEFRSLLPQHEFKISAHHENSNHSIIQNKKTNFLSKTFKPMVYSFITLATASILLHKYKEKIRKPKKAQ